MIQLLCDDCKKPIDPMVDNHLNVPDLTIRFSGKMGRFTLHFCHRDHFISWLKKHGEPSGIIAATDINDLRGPAA